MISNTRERGVFAAIMAASLCAALGLWAWATPTARPTRPYVAQARAQIHAYDSWCNAPWTGDDRPYQILRTDIEREATDGQKAVALMRKYELELAKEPHDFQAQFAYYYAAYWAVVLPDGLTPREENFRLGNLYLSIARVPHPHTYNYARLAFLCQAHDFPDPDMKDLGLRLVHQDPSDYQVIYNTISVLLAASVLLAGDKSSNEAEALTLAESLVNRYPEKPSVYAQLAGVYRQMWFTSKSPAEAKEAIAGYRKYLSLAPANAPFRAQAERLIAQMERG